MKSRTIKFKAVMINIILVATIFVAFFNVAPVAALGSISGHIYMTINGSRVPLKGVRLVKEGTNQNGNPVDQVSWYETNEDGYYSIDDSAVFYKNPQGNRSAVLGSWWCGSSIDKVFGGWCGLNCGQNPNRIKAYFPDGYQFTKTKGDFSKGSWYLTDRSAACHWVDWTEICSPGVETEGGVGVYIRWVANNSNYINHDFEWRPILPTPTPLPTATPTPIPPTPTPIQPTAVVSLPLPQAEAFSADERSKLGQSWICIESLPCSQTGVQCSEGGNPEHKVLIKTKEGTALKMSSAPTYVFECISPDQQSYRCTTGNDSLDQTLISKSNLSGLRADYEYRFVSYTNMDGGRIIQTTDVNSLSKTTATGTFGPYQWESETDVQVWRLIMTMQDLDWNSAAQQGSEGALQQATFSFTNGDYNKDCVIIMWDPQGTIYDIASLRPMEGVKVTLYVKNAAGIFVPMEDKKWGLLANPILSSAQGNYQFFVPAGTYKIEVEKQGYELITDKNIVSSIKKIKNIYGGGEITTKGEIQEVNILMRKKSMLHSIVDMVESLFIHEK